MRNRKATTADFLIAGFLFLLVLAVVVPFINTIAISFLRRGNISIRRFF